MSLDLNIFLSKLLQSSFNAGLIIKDGTWHVAVQRMSIAIFFVFTKSKLKWPNFCGLNLRLLMFLASRRQGNHFVDTPLTYYQRTKLILVMCQRTLPSYTSRSHGATLAFIRSYVCIHWRTEFKHLLSFFALLWFQKTLFNATENICIMSFLTFEEPNLKNNLCWCHNDIISVILTWALSLHIHNTQPEL